MSLPGYGPKPGPFQSSLNNAQACTRREVGRIPREKRYLMFGGGTAAARETRPRRSHEGRRGPVQTNVRRRLN